MIHWVDRLTAPIAPRWTAKRARARLALDMLAHYEAGGRNRRTSGWVRPSTDANAAQLEYLATTRNDARELVRNNPYAESALMTIVDHVCGSWGIAATTTDKRAGGLWTAWTETTACDADGKQNFAGLQRTVMRTVAESGECLVRRRWRQAGDKDSLGRKLPIPLQLQVLEPDFLDTSKEQHITAGGGWITQGIEYNAIGRIVRYWLFNQHPGSGRPGILESRPVNAEEIIHVFLPGRAGAARAITWFANVILRMKDFDEYEDAALMKQKIAACLAVLTTDNEGTGPALGEVTPGAGGRLDVDMIEPGTIGHIPAGRQINVVEPPSVNEHDAYAKTVLRAIATGLGLAYEDLTGDYTGMPFSAARMSRLRHWARVHGWRWGMFIPQFLEVAWTWAMQAAIVGTMKDESPITAIPPVEWTAPPPPMLDPAVEGLAYTRLLRIGGITWPEMIRELGYDPVKQLAEIKAWKQLIDAAGLVFDSDPAHTTQGGQLQGAAAGASGNTLEAALHRDVEAMVRQIIAETAPAVRAQSDLILSATTNGAEH